VRNPRKKQRLTPANKFARQAFSFCLIFFCSRKKMGLLTIMPVAGASLRLFVVLRTPCRIPLEMPFFLSFFSRTVRNPCKKQRLTPANEFARQAFSFDGTLSKRRLE
jgi:hypothetical protein